MKEESRLHIRNNMAPFEEFLGVVEAIQISDSVVSAILTCTYSESVAIRFRRNTMEAKILEEKLSKLLGQKVAILRIPDSQNPLRIRKVKNENKRRNVTITGPKRIVESNKGEKNNA